MLRRSTLIVLLCCAACSSVSEDSEAIAGEACADGNRRCDGLDWQVCERGSYVSVELCTDVCDANLGCDFAPVNACEVAGDELDAVTECDETAPPNSFEPEIQWTWSGEGIESMVNVPQSWVTPLVANLTDDDGSGDINLCDTPDVVVVAFGAVDYYGRIYILDGATGALHVQISEPVDASVTPALGDIDGDGLPEIVTVATDGRLIAFEHDGALKWSGGAQLSETYVMALALADIDADGDVEIIGGNHVSDHNGTLLWTAPQPAGAWSATATADLDGDGMQEVVLGHAAYHHDGTEYFVAPGIEPGFPAIANLDDDVHPEILVTNRNGITLLEHDGSVKFQDLRPTGDPVDFTGWIRPATIHDFDGDGRAEFAVSSNSNYAVYDSSGAIRWTADVLDDSGIAAGTAFDFLGDGTAEAMYADETTMYIFGEGGESLLQIERGSGTLSEYPVVADIDNDGSAEIVVVSTQHISQSPAVQVIRDVGDRWIQARRIWNQHTYHVSNVREDGTIPQNEKPSWKGLNTFRTNAQLAGGAVCAPPVVE